MIADHCAHRSASLLYGRVEERGIACAYHGWLYDTRGNILETPPERLERAGEIAHKLGAPSARDTSDDAIMKSVKQRAYPVRRYIGLYWAYLGPEPAPVIPKYDVWARQDGRRKIAIRFIYCNWFQAMENSVDPAHLQILHQEFAGRDGRVPASTTRGFTDDVAEYEFYRIAHGIVKKRIYKNGLLDEPELEYSESHKQPAEMLHPFTRFTMDSVAAQDYMAWETQGSTADRSREHLSYSDRGVAMLRRLLRENIERVQQGLDPMSVVRDPGHAIIDTNLDDGIEQTVASRAPTLAA